MIVISNVQISGPTCQHDIFVCILLYDALTFFPAASCPSGQLPWLSAGQLFFAVSHAVGCHTTVILASAAVCFRVIWCNLADSSAVKLLHNAAAWSGSSLVCSCLEWKQLGLQLLAPHLSSDYLRSFSLCTACWQVAAHVPQLDSLST